MKNLLKRLSLIALFSTFFVFSCQKGEDAKPNANVANAILQANATTACTVVTRPVASNLASTGVYNAQYSGGFYSRTVAKWTKMNNSAEVSSIKFSDRGDLAKVLGTIAPENAHHVIPWQWVDDFGGSQSKLHPVVKTAALVGFHPNDNYNGINLAVSRDGGVHSTHPAYNAWVEKQLNEYQTRFGVSNQTAANEWLQCKLISRLKAMINGIPAGQTIQTYFSALPTFTASRDFVLP